jgi:quinol monooxygenase YgiN
MVVEYVRYTIPEASRADFEAAYLHASSVLDESEHCLDYELSRCTEEPGSYILRIEWDSAEGHMQGFRRSPRFPAFFAAVRPYFDSITEMRHYEVTGVRSARG